MYIRRFISLCSLVIIHLNVLSSQTTSLFEEALPVIIGTEKSSFGCNKENTPTSLENLPHMITLREKSPGKGRGVFFLGATQYAVSVDSLGVLRWWDTEKCELVKEIETGLTGITGYAVTKEGTFIAVAAGNKVTVWDAQTYSLLGTIEHDEPVETVSLNGSFSTDTIFLAAGGKLGKAWVWDLQKYFSGTKTECMSVVHERRPLYPSLASVHAIHVTQDGKRLMTVQDTSIKVWDCLTGQCIQTGVLPCPAIVSKIRFIDDSHCISCFTDGTVLLTTFPSLASRVIQLPKKGYRCALLSSEGKFILHAGIIVLWQRNENQTTPFRVASSFDGEEGHFNHVAVSNDRLGFITSEFGGILRFWSMRRPSNGSTLSAVQQALLRPHMTDLTMQVGASFWNSTT